MEGPYNYTDCHFDSMAVCAASVSGTGATCRANPSYVREPVTPPAAPVAVTPGPRKKHQ
jgi:hypothetical protein